MSAYGHVFFDCSYFLFVKRNMVLISTFFHIFAPNFRIWFLIRILSCMQQQKFAWVEKVPFMWKFTFLVVEGPRSVFWVLDLDNSIKWCYGNHILKIEPKITLRARIILILWISNICGTKSTLVSELRFIEDYKVIIWP